jgi:PAS domain S-box-containing protein
MSQAVIPKRAEEALQESEKRFRTLLESAPVAIVIVDSTGRIVLVNAKTEAMFGYRRDELIGQTVEILLPERFQKVHVGHRANYLVEPRIRPMGLGLELAGRRKDGTEFPIEIGLGFTETDGEVLAMSFITDITERKQAEAALQAAVVAERNRLARDLHDAVTQTLFSASLIAEVLPRLWERHPAEGERRLDELRQLTRGALAEMRTLLLELRPMTLREVELGDLLRQLTEAITGRARVPVTLTVEGNSPLAPDVRVALYRIAQEALNNVAKHAGANQAAVSLRYEETMKRDTERQESREVGGHINPRTQVLRVELRISDDGRGFNPSQVSADHLGLDIMRERAEAIGALLTIESRVGEGTQVLAVWKDEGRKVKDERE